MRGIEVPYNQLNPDTLKTLVEEFTEVYHDRFMGEDSIHCQSPIPKKRGDEILALIRNCPKPNNKRCTCGAHREFM